MAINVTNMKQNPQKKSPALGRSQYQSQILQKGFPIKSAVSPIKCPNFFKIGFNKSSLAILNSTNLPSILFTIHEQFLWAALSQLNIFLNNSQSTNLYDSCPPPRHIYRQDMIHYDSFLIKF